MIVVDGRTDREKLFELLKSGGECSELDFKETLDFSKKIDELDFVKDAVSMCNRYPGGYIVIGVDDDGNPSTRSEDTNWGQFDGAVLTDKIRKYVQAPLTAISQLHEVDGHTYCLVCLLSLEDGLLVPFSKLGQTVNGKGHQSVVFREGEMVRRDGAQNRPIEYSQWTEILKQHDACVRKDESKRMDALVDKIIAVLGEKGKTRLSSMAWMKKHLYARLKLVSSRRRVRSFLASFIRSPQGFKMMQMQSTALLALEPMPLAIVMTRYLRKRRMLSTTATQQLMIVKRIQFQKNWLWRLPVTNWVHNWFV